MDLSQRTTTIAGIAMIIGAILTVIAVVLMASGTSDESPFEDEEAAEFLTDVNDNQEQLLASAAVGILNDAVFVPVIAVAFFILFRDRNPFLATAAMVGIAVTAAISLLVDGSNLLLTIIAEDYVEGGPEGVEPGDPATLQLGRYIGMITFAFTNVLFSAAGMGLLAIGLLLVGAPEGLVNPPRWLGWVAIISGVSSGLAWLVLAAEPFFVFFPIQGLSLLVLLVGLGIWLVRHGDLQPAPMRA
jgi:Domain of unknown function (DUF4386)